MCFDLSYQHFRGLHHQVWVSSSAYYYYYSLERVHLGVLPLRSDQWQAYRDLHPSLTSGLPRLASGCPPLQRDCGFAFLWFQFVHQAGNQGP